MIPLRKSQAEALEAIRSIAPATVYTIAQKLYGGTHPMLIKQAGARLGILARLQLVAPVGPGQRRPGAVRGTTPILWVVSDKPAEKPSPKPCPPPPAPGRAAVLAMLSEPMTRHAVAERMGCSYDSAAQYIAQLQADYKVTPCGRERGPGGRGWRMQFRAIGGAAC